MEDDHRIYHVSVTATHEAFVSATSEEAAKAKALDMDPKDMKMNDDVSVSVDVGLWENRVKMVPWPKAEGGDKTEGEACPNGCGNYKQYADDEQCGWCQDKRDTEQGAP